MTGWLIVNGFIGSEKFNELYGYLERAAQKHAIDLKIKSSDSLTGVVGERISDGLPDFVLFWDKDIHLARRIESLGVRLFNSASAVEICDSKALTALALVGKVETPRTIIAPKTFEGVGYTRTEFVENATRVLGLPMIIKESYGSFGAQVHLARTEGEALGIIADIAPREFIMQEFIKESSGRDVRVNVVGGRVVSAMERYNEHDFRSNITNGGSMRKIDLSKDIENAAIKATEVIGLDFAGVDVLFGKDGPIVCEVNSNPHFKTSLLCTGVDMSEKIMEYIVRCME